MKTPTRTFLYLFALLLSINSFSQAAGDYRSSVDQWHRDRVEGLKRGKRLAKPGWSLLAEAGEKYLRQRCFQ